jgi:hypothetical protein
MATSNNNEAVSALLKNLTESLMQMVSKYEIIVGYCDRIYEKAETMSDQLHDVKEIREIASNIRAQCEHNQQAISNVMNTLNSAKEDIDDLIAKTETDHAQHTEKLNAIIGKLTIIGEETSESLVNVEAKIDDTRSRMAPVAKLAKLISTPLGIVIFILGFFVAIFTVTEIVSKVTETFKKDNNPSTSSVPPDSTNRTSNHIH